MSDNWSPITHGLSVSMLQSWARDRCGCGLKYIQGLYPLERFSSVFAYGTYFQAAFEGYVNSSHQVRGAQAWVDKAVLKDKQTFGPGKYEEIHWWSSLALYHFLMFKDYYTDTNLPLSEVTESERNVRVEIELPSGRTVVLNAYLDGEGESLLYEGKCRSQIKKDAIAREIRWDLQYNYYLLAVYSDTGELPKKVWYQTNLRPCGFGYRGPRQKKNETLDGLGERIREHMTQNPDTYMWRFIGLPTMDELKRFCHGCLYPMLEAFLDWYEYMTSPDKENLVNRFDWVTPYGFFDPLLEGMEEDYRNYRLSGLQTGLVRRKK